jgi:DNA-binding response OmpR family regulator
MKKVLIIDDELDICLLLQAFLKKNDFSAYYACRLEEGAAQLFKTTPDILILDNNLPDGYGIEHIETFKRKFPHLKLIMISAMSEIKEAALDKGADYFLKKPFSLKKIEELLKYPAAA